MRNQGNQERYEARRALASVFAGLATIMTTLPPMLVLTKKTDMLNFFLALAKHGCTAQGSSVAKAAIQCINPANVDVARTEAHQAYYGDDTAFITKTIIMPVLLLLLAAAIGSMTYCTIPSARSSRLFNSHDRVKDVTGEGEEVMAPLKAQHS